MYIYIYRQRERESLNSGIPSYSGYAMCAERCRYGPESRYAYVKRQSRDRENERQRDLSILVHLFLSGDALCAERRRYGPESRYVYV